jgi:hypothetical protein
MATRIIPNQSEGETPKITVEFDNGDLEALNGIVDDWKFCDQVSALRFALAIMSKSKNGVVYVYDENGVRQPLSPSPSLLKKNGNEC